MIEIPDLTRVDIIFGNIKCLPPYEEIPDTFKHSNRWVEFIGDWFFKGVPREDIDKLVPKPGIDKQKALNAVAACLSSWEPKHEHKIAGCAYLMSEWFE